MTDIKQLIDELQDLVDDKRERVAKLFADIRESVPRPMTLVFSVDYSCETAHGTYRYWRSTVMKKWFWTVSCRSVAFAGGESKNEQEAIAAMQSHFNAAWSAMTAKGAAT